MISLTDEALYHRGSKCLAKGPVPRIGRDKLGQLTGLQSEVRPMSSQCGRRVSALRNEYPLAPGNLQAKETCKEENKT